MNIILFQTNKCTGFIKSNEFEPNTGLLFIELKFYIKFKLNAKELEGLTFPCLLVQKAGGMGYLSLNLSLTFSFWNGGVILLLCWASLRQAVQDDYSWEHFSVGVCCSFSVSSLAGLPSERTISSLTRERVSSSSLSVTNLRLGQTFCMMMDNEQSILFCSSASLQSTRKKNSKTKSDEGT